MKKTTSIAAILIGVAVLFNTAIAQLGGWHIVNAKLVFNKKWSSFIEAQTRSFELTNRFFYHEYKGGISYNINSNANVLVGTGQYVTYNNTKNFERVTQSEHRIWEQFTLTNNIDRLKIEHRYRFEQRFIAGNFRNRFRYRLNAIVPLNNRTVTSGTFYVSVFDEIFLNNRAPVFERNRLYGGAGYQFNKVFTFQLGYINQYDQRYPAHTSKGFLQSSLLFNLDKKQIFKDRHPSTMD